MLLCINGEAFPPKSEANIDIGNNNRANKSTKSEMVEFFLISFVYLWFKNLIEKTKI